jgi:DNA-binding MarR family transcriptional regulator
VGASLTRRAANVYDVAVTVATFSGFASPVRGLAPYTEAERDVFFGRDRDRDELVRMVTADGFRAGLVYGETGVGKTSLLRAGVIPHLRDHGVIVSICEDASQPAESLAAGLGAAGLSANPGEAAVAFLARAVSSALAGQQFVFVLDDADQHCTADARIAEIGELFARVVTRSGGRARFLFACAAEQVHLLGHLERRTGSLFPPPSRHELMRLPVTEATSVLDRMLSLAGITADAPLAEAIASGLGRGGPVLPADLQLAAIAVRDLAIASPAALAKLGGAGELERAWLEHACRATGNERLGLRMVAELATAEAPPRTATWVADRMGEDATRASAMLATLEERGVLRTVTGDGGGLVLRHPVLAPRVRELTAPARAAARRAYDLLGSKTASRARMSWRELRALRAEGIAPMTADEKAVVSRSKRFYWTIAGAIAAAPIAVCILVWFTMRGRTYFDIDHRPGGDRIVVRGGRAGLRAFHWLPGGRFGAVLADTGLSRAMVAPAAWAEIADHDHGGGGDWADDLSTIAAPQLAGLIDYASTGDGAALTRLGKAAREPDDLAELLIALRPIARGTPAEIELIEGALVAKSPAVQKAAVAVAGAAAQRKDGIYRDTLVQALTSADPELRRIAFTAVRGLGEDRARPLFAAALAKDPDAAARRELLVEVSSAVADDAPTASTAVSVLADPASTPAMRARAEDQLDRSFALDTAAAAAAAAALIGNDKAPTDARVLAIRLCLEADDLPQSDALAAAARTAYGAKAENLRAAALPLYARVDPTRAAGDLATLFDDRRASRAMRTAMATAWGELTRTRSAAAAAALEKLIKDPVPEVSAAAAAAYGRLGRVAQDPLTKMVKNGGGAVSVGAALGLAASAEVGASVGVAVDGIAQLWKQKGGPRRQAAKIFARLAKRKTLAVAVMDYLSSAARSPEDAGLHPLGVEGLCNASLAGVAAARANLARVTDDPSADVRRLVMRCVADGPDPAKNGVAIAARLVKDAEPSIRAEAARVLALSADRGGKVSGGVGDALVALAEDGDRDVRLIAVRALAGLGAAAPPTTAAAFGRAFERADEGEKLALLRAARAIGATDLVAIAIADGAPLVRIEAVETAIATGGRAAAAVSAALADADPQVRRAALARLAEHPDKLEAAVVERALSLAVRDPDPELSQLALTTLARVGDKDAVAARLGHSLASRAERDRAQAAAAAVGLVDRYPELATKLLTPLIDDPSHDVRVALLPSLAAVYAKTNAPDQLGALLRAAETDADRRLIATAAFVTLARTDAGKAAAESTLGAIARTGEPMAQRQARLALGLIAANADGIGFLQQLVP